MEHTGAVLAISAILLGAGIAFAYVYIVNINVSITPKSTATVNLFVTTPQKFAANVSSLLVYFSEIDAHSVDATVGWLPLFKTQTSVDLAKTFGTSQQLGSFSIPVGSYDSIRMGISQSSEVVSGTTVPLAVPAAAQVGLVVLFPAQFNLASGAVGGVSLAFAVDTMGLAAKTMNPTVSVNLELGIGATTGTNFGTSFVSTTSTTTTTTSKSCVLGINSWPFC